MSEERRNANQYPSALVVEEAGRFAESVASFQPEDVAAADVASQDGLLLEILAFLDVPSLVQKKQVSRQWKRLCTRAIDLSLIHI